jgi:hypothetical protein
MSTWRRREETAQLIWDDLKANGDSSKRAIQNRTGLTHMQFWYGMGFLRDELQADNGQPLIWSPRWGVYSLTTSERDWYDYLVDWRLKSIETQLLRTEQTAIAGGMLFGRRKQAIRVIIAGITSARQMVQALRP